jgi:hypothetical protein
VDEVFTAAIEVTVGRKVIWCSERHGPVSLVVSQVVYFLIGPVRCVFNPLNAELNPICHSLILLGDLTFMGPCIVSIFQYTSIYNKMQR